MFCSKCGKEVPEDKTFCTHCGAPLVKAQDRGPSESASAAEAPQAPPVTREETATPVVPIATEAKKRKLFWPVAGGVAAVLVAVAVILVLVLVVFKSSGPATTVASFFKAIEDKNQSAAMETVDTSFFKGNKDLETTFQKEVLGTMPEGVKFTGMQYETETSGGKTVVKVTKGTATYTENGKQQSVDITKLEGGNRFDMVKVNGAWLISPRTFGGVFASAFKSEADTIFRDKVVPKSGEIENAFKALSSSMSAQPPPSAQQMKAQLQQVEALLKEYKSLGEKSKAEYKKILELNGSGLEDYKAYAEAAMGFIDTSVKVFDESVAFLDYVISAKAQSESGTMPDMAVYNQKTTEYSKLVAELEQKLKGYQDQMEALQQKLE